MSKFNVAPISTLLGIKSAHPRYDFNWWHHRYTFTFKSGKRFTATNRPQKAGVGIPGGLPVLLFAKPPVKQKLTVLRQ